MTSRLARIAITGLVLGVPPSASAATLDAPARLEITGLGGEPTGLSAAAAGDVNGDGRPDVIVGTPGADVPGRGDAGAAYVIYGAPGRTHVDVRRLGLRGFQVTGARTFLKTDLTDEEFGGDATGGEVSAAGDMNGDGLGDVAISVPYSGAGLRYTGGSVYVVYGRRTPLPVDLARLGAAGFRIDGDRVGDQLGGVTSLGDTNGDGLGDLGLTSSRSGSYVVAGSRAGTTVDLRALGDRGTHIRRTTGTRTEYGEVRIASAGDVDRDGLTDIALGDPRASRPGRAGAGAVWIIRGARAPGTVTLDGRDPRTGRFDGPLRGTALGRAVAPVGDVDGDRRPDLVAGGRRTSFLLYGGSGRRVDLATHSGAATAIRTPGGDIGFGTAVSGPGDVDGDGRPDAAIAAPTTDRGCRSDAGAVYVVRGGRRRPGVSLADPSPAWYRVGGSRPGANAGSVLGGGDGELVVGTPGTEPQRRYRVAVLARIRGRAPVGSVARRCLRVASPARNGRRVAATGRLPVTLAAREGRPLFDTAEVSARVLRRGPDRQLGWREVHLGRVPVTRRFTFRLSRQGRAYLRRHPRVRIRLTASQEALGNTRRVHTTVRLR